jgi:hypothetical protein
MPYLLGYWIVYYLLSAKYIAVEHWFDCVGNTHVFRSF